MKSDDEVRSEEDVCDGIENASVQSDASNGAAENQSTLSDSYGEEDEVM